MTQAIIRRAFETRLKTWADAQTPVIPVAWENVPFTPPAGRYARAFLLPVDTQSETLERTDRKYRGVFQVSLCMNLGTGAAAAESLVASLAAHFAHTFTQATVTVWLKRPMGAAPPIPEPDRYVVPVSTEYEANVL
jgi:hypothetical protein